MSFLQVNFWIFLILSILAYYVLPKKYQWICLLINSYVFYTYTGIRTIGYILFTTITIWWGSLVISKIEEEKKTHLFTNKDSLTSKEKKQIKEMAKKKKRKIFWSVLLINFGILAFLKYFNFTAKNINSLFNLFLESKKEPITLGLLLPLGISFYTFQSIGYLIDVYNGKYKVEKIYLNLHYLFHFFLKLYKVLLIDLINWLFSCMSTVILI